MRIPLLALAALLATVATAPVLAPPPLLVALPVGRLPAPAFAQAAVWIGHEVFVLGGADHVCYCELDAIVAHDPATGEVRTLEVRLPSRAAWGSAVWDGQRVHFFDGPTIVHLDPATGGVTATRSSRTVPYSALAFYDGRHAYVFQHYGRPVLRYDPPADAYEELAVRQPLSTSWAALASDGRMAYLFGGEGPSGASAAIWRFDPTGPSFTLLQAKLPLAVTRPAAVWDAASGTALVVGGFALVDNPALPLALPGVAERREVWRFDPAAETVSLAGVLPWGLWGVAAAATPQGVFTYGGGCLCPPTSVPALSGEPLAAPSEVFSGMLQNDFILRLSG